MNIGKSFENFKVLLSCLLICIFTNTLLYANSSSKEQFVVSSSITSASSNLAFGADKHLKAPQELLYSRDSKKRGVADGNVVITPPEEVTGLTGYALYWGNEAGIFNDFSAIKVKSNGSEKVTHLLNKNTMIPTGATKLYAYSLFAEEHSVDPAVFSLPLNIDYPRAKPLFSFQVISDTHILSDPNHESTEQNIKHLKRAFTEIQAIDPKSVAIINTGDVTDSGTIAEFQQYNSIVNSFENLPPLYCVPGNHDLVGEGGWKAQIEKFMTYTGAPAPFYAKEIEGMTFIFLGSQVEGNPILSSSILADQRKFLSDELEKASKSSKPIFVFHHQPLYNTVSGTLPGQGWNGIEQDGEIRAILRQYPQTIFFTGHTHWELDAKSPMYDGQGADATMFNTPSVAYLWTDAQETLTGSEGYFVEVYKDKILVRGRDFKNEKWVTNAQFIVDTTVNKKSNLRYLPVALLLMKILL